MNSWTRLASGIDRAITRSIGKRNQRARGELAPISTQAKLQHLSEVTAKYHALCDPSSVFETHTTAPIAHTFDVQGALRDGTPLHDLSFTSAMRPLDPGLATVFADEDNARVRTRWIGRPGSMRPLVILVHGYLGGDFRWEQRFFPVKQLRSWGYDLCLATLPFHGLRKQRDRKGPPKFPSADPSLNIEGFRQAIIDLRSLVTIAQARGCPQIGVLGMSLGGYTASLLATAEPRLDFCMPMIPLASLADFTRDMGRLPGDLHEQRVMHTALEECMALVSPTQRSAVIDPARIVVVGADGDQVTPISHAKRLADHFGSALVTFEGAHLLQLGRARALEQARALLS
ncbi:MAG: alpha/beta hydrolase family protein [Deltaproteobacteria bacterium]|nr:alpha/beta hydrolase family protein [Deltaproteobacteria bacterium]